MGKTSRKKRKTSRKASKKSSKSGLKRSKSSKCRRRRSPSPSSSSSSSAASSSSYSSSSSSSGHVDAVPKRAGALLYEKNEIEFMMTSYLENKKMLCSREKTSDAVEKRRSLYKDMSSAMVQRFGVYRSCDSLKEKIKRLRSYVKKEEIEKAKFLKKTGGGSNEDLEKHLTKVCGKRCKKAYYKLVLSTLDKAQLSGIPGGIDSSKEYLARSSGSQQLSSDRSHVESQVARSSGSQQLSSDRSHVESQVARSSGSHQLSSDRSHVESQVARSSGSHQLSSDRSHVESQGSLNLSQMHLDFDGRIIPLGGSNFGNSEVAGSSFGWTRKIRESLSSNCGQQSQASTSKISRTAHMSEHRRLSYSPNADRSEAGQPECHLDGTNQSGAESCDECEEESGGEVSPEAPPLSPGGKNGFQDNQYPKGDELRSFVNREELEVQDVTDLNNYLHEGYFLTMAKMKSGKICLRAWNKRDLVSME